MIQRYFLSFLHKENKLCVIKEVPFPLQKHAHTIYFDFSRL